jgi:flagellar M-ring protein FliF
MLNELMERVGGPRRVLLGVVGIGAALLILLISRVATAPTWVPAISNVPIESASELVDRLAQASIAYKLDHGGAEILVAEPDLARARVALAKDGLPGGSRPGLELFDRPTWGWNDFTQRVNYRRALEGELERTIGRMRGVDRAEVHLAISEQSAFRRADERPTTASVLLALKNGGAPAPEVVQGIAHLVSSSVDGLQPENVSIHDETGRQWSEPNDRGSIGGLTSHQLRVQQDVEAYLQKKAETLVSQMVGTSNARVQVSANINFDKVERTTQAIDPERQALATEQKAEVTPGTAGGGASTNMANSYENSKSTEVFSSAIGNIKRLTVAVLVNEKRVPGPGGADTASRLQERPAAELAEIETLVRTAVGIDTTRGDKVSVVSMPFETTPIAPEPVVLPDVVTRVQQFERPALTGFALVLAFIVALLALRPLRAGTASRAPDRLAAAPAPAAALPAPAAASPMQVPRPPAEPKFVFPEANTEIRDRVLATVSQNPDNAARLVKTWIKAS